MGLPIPVPAYPVPPGLAHQPGSIRIGEQVGDRIDDFLVGSAVDHPAGLAVANRLRRTARTAGHHGHSGGRGLQKHDAQTLDIQARPPGATRHREDVRHRVMTGQFGGGNAAGEHDIGGYAAVLGQFVQGIGVRPAADDDQCGAGDSAPDLRHRPDQHVLTLARYQS